MAGPLRSTDITPLHRSYWPFRLPFAVHRFPGVSGYTVSFSAAFTSGRSGSLQLLRAPLSSCCRFNPASVIRRVSQLRRLLLPSLYGSELGPWGFRFSRPYLRSLSLRPDDLLTILKDGFVDRFRKFGFSPLRYPSYKVLTFTLVGLPPTEHTSFS